MRFQSMPYRGYSPSDEDRAAFLEGVTAADNANSALIAIVSNYQTAVSGLLREVEVLQKEKAELEKDIQIALGNRSV